jgi:hypothetical protein
MRAALLALLSVAAASCSVVGIEPKLTDAQHVIADIKFDPSELHIIGGVDRADRRYKPGEPILLSFQVNKPAYVAVLRVLPNGTTTLLLPNRHQGAAPAPADAVQRFPAPGMPFTITADKPGLLLFEFIATTRSGSWLFTRKPAGSADFTELGATTRAVAKDIASSLRRGGGAEAAAAHLAVRVEAP